MQAGQQVVAIVKQKEIIMAGPKTAAQRSKPSKHLRSQTKKKRHKNENSVAQAKYHAAIAARRAKKKKKR